MRRAATSLALLVLAAAPAWAAQVQLTLHTGETVHGELVRTTDALVVVRRTHRGSSGSVTAEVGYPRDQVVTVLDLDEEYRRRAGAAATDSADAQLALARWCRDSGMPERAATHAHAVLAMDRISGGALQVLDQCGFVEIDGKWVMETDWLAERGLVRFNGQVMSFAERDELRKVLLVRNQARNAVATTTAAVAQAKQAADDAEARLAEITQGIPYAEKRIKDNDQAAAQKRLDAAKKRFDGEAAKLKAKPSDVRIQRSYKAAEAAYKAEQDRVNRAGPEREKAQRELEAFKRDKPLAERRKTETQAALAPARQALDEAQGRLTAAETQVRDLVARITPAALPATVPPKKTAPAAVEGTGLGVQDL